MSAAWCSGWKEHLKLHQLKHLVQSTSTTWLSTAVWYKRPGVGLKFLLGYEACLVALACCWRLVDRNMYIILLLNQHLVICCWMCKSNMLDGWQSVLITKRWGDMKLVLPLAVDLCTQCCSYQMMNIHIDPTYTSASPDPSHSVVVKLQLCSLKAAG